MTKEVTLHFSKPGLLTTVQDQGRLGYQAFGVPQAGALDIFSAQLANEILQNPASTPVLEITLMGPVITFSGRCQIALCGADLSPRRNEEPCPMYETVEMAAGDVLRFGRVVQGCRVYLAIRGVWQLKPWLGSYSYSAQNGEELTPDSKIKRDSRLRISPLPYVAKRIYPERERPSYPNTQKIRVLAGPEFEDFSNYVIGHFFSNNFTITAESNRMGYRLAECLRDFIPKKEVISSGIVPGTIQVTNAGLPIVLLADAQTSGGYPRLANVLRDDLAKMAQLKPGDKVQFSLVAPDGMNN